MRGLLRRILTVESSILLLTMVALVSLPIALRKVVPDAAWTLLLPVTLLSTWAVFSLRAGRDKSIWAVLVIFGAGPLAMFFRIGQINETLLAAVRESVRILPALMLPSRSYDLAAPQLSE